MPLVVILPIVNSFISLNLIANEYSLITPRIRFDCMAFTARAFQDDRKWHERPSWSRSLPRECRRGYTEEFRCLSENALLIRRVSV